MRCVGGANNFLSLEKRIIVMCRVNFLPRELRGTGHGDCENLVVRAALDNPDFSNLNFIANLPEYTLWRCHQTIAIDSVEISRVSGRAGGVGRKEKHEGREKTKTLG